MIYKSITRGPVLTIVPHISHWCSLNLLSFAMLIDTVDKDDHVVGVIEKDAALAAGVNFRVVHVFVFNEKGQLLIQQIPQGKRHGGMWGSSIAGYVYSGESYEQAAHRRLNQELAINTPQRTIHAPLPLILKTTMKEGAADKFIALFATRISSLPAPNPLEVAAIDGIDIDAIERFTETGLRQFTPTFLHLIKAFKTTSEVTP